MQPPSARPSPPSDPRTSQQAHEVLSPDDASSLTTELSALRRVLSASRGAFSLSIATCNSPAYRDRLIEQFRVEDPAILRVPLPADATNILDAVRAAVDGAGTAPSAVMIVDVEKALPSTAPVQPLLLTLNASRERWRDLFACPVVFWLPEYAVTLLAGTARDFWAWRSHLFDFEPPEAATAAGADQTLFAGAELAANLDEPAKRLRITELELRLRELGDDPPPALRVHAAVWLNELGFLHYALGDLDEAERLHRKSLEINEKLGWLEGMASQYGNLGLIYQTRGDLDEAERLFRKSLEIFEKLGRLEGMANACANLGSVQTQRGDLAGARALWTKARDLFARIGMPHMVAQVQGWIDGLPAAADPRNERRHLP
jgi:hypothetical protein